ncbi:MAG: HTH domain-containing protein [Clostridia bacterium]|nr:HTH domain-containing protein [Clostridia bacterium]
MDAVERRERIIRILMLRGQTSVKELAEQTEVSERTILRDVNFLSQSVPITTVSGRYGGVCIADFADVCRPVLREAELALLRKIISDTEKGSACSLSASELQLLRDMVTKNSNQKHKKGKKG